MGGGRVGLREKAQPGCRGEEAARQIMAADDDADLPAPALMRGHEVVELGVLGVQRQLIAP